MRVMMLLADSAQEVNGKLYVLGGGWNILQTAPAPTAVAMHIHVPWDRTNMQHRWRLELLDGDGEPVLVPGPLGEQPLVAEGAFEVGRPPGITPGSELGVSMALTIGPVPLTPGGRYVWRLTIGDETRDDWRLPFSVAGTPTHEAPEQPEA